MPATQKNRIVVPEWLSNQIENAARATAANASRRRAYKTRRVRSRDPGKPARGDGAHWRHNRYSCTHRNRNKDLNCLPSKDWRKRVGVEPTIHPAKGRIAGFEDREDHRTPFTSAHAEQNDKTRINPQP